MTDVMPRVILDELVALAVHQLGEEEAARDLVDQMLADHPELAAAAIEAPTPAERLQAVDRLFGRVRWAVRERLSGARRPPATATPAPPPAPPSDAAPARAKAPPWAPSPPPPPATPSIPRSMAVPPPAMMPKLEPPRTFIPVPTPPSAEPEAETAPETPAAMEDGVPVIERAPAGPAVDGPPRSAPPEPPAFTAPSRPMMRPRPAPPVEPAGADSPPPSAPQRHEPPPLQFEIIDDLYGLEARARRRRRVLIALATLAVAAGAGWLVVTSDLPRQIQGWEWAAAPPASPTDGASPTRPPPLEALQLEAPKIASDGSGDDAADRPALGSETAADNGTRRILRLDPRPEPAAGPVAEESAGSPPAAEEAVRVFIHYDADARSASDAAAALYARLTNGSGYATVVLRDVPYAIGSHRIRYYFPEDRAAATALAERLGDPPAGDWQLQDFSFYRPQPVRGTLEVFVPTG